MSSSHRTGATAHGVGPKERVLKRTGPLCLPKRVLRTLYKPPLKVVKGRSLSHSRSFPKVSADGSVARDVGVACAPAPPLLSRRAGRLSLGDAYIPTEQMTSLSKGALCHLNC